ncbi:nucleophile aminohydrolase [Kockovaella imperatae]|uniref:Nucleophile aminohydrolase n=1 Tax=Kockovaella imperatae TaxID=4999 RepID=A0A1Y1UJK0_9TREE|nr:nucleophile aminohydrolase [Kockovaella imperatae]ORX37717.1 nucleophile aminohydrolase [Kockovaella imperatae]
MTLLSGAIASEHVTASKIGAGILKAGGNAADAVVATILALGTVCMYHSDLGGGGFAIIRTSDGRHEALDFRQCAPAAAHADMVMDAASPRGMTVAVPGQLKGLEALHQRHGRLPWSRLFAESIQLAENGFQMRHDLYHYCSNGKSPYITSRRGTRTERDKAFDFLFDDHGDILSQGSIIKRSAYSKVLRAVAERGSKRLLHRSNSPRHHYKVNWSDPIQGKFKDKTLWSVPAPASGSIWIHAMSMLAHLEIDRAGTSEDLHKMIEVQRLAYPQRTKLGDPAFIEGISNIERALVDPLLCQERARTIDDQTHVPDHYKKAFSTKFDRGTSNITVADSDGLVISITTTVGSNFGSGIIVPELGMVLNDSMQDFSSKGIANWTGYESSTANYSEPFYLDLLTHIVAGGKRPLSSSCPYIVEDAQGNPILAGGAAGGSTIISGNIQVARNVLEHGMTASEALRSTRVHNQLSPNSTQVEHASTHLGVLVEGLSPDQAAALESRGHVLEWLPESRLVACCIKFHYTNKGIEWDAAADPRKEDSGASVYMT